MRPVPGGRTAAASSASGAWARWGWVVVVGDDGDIDEGTGMYQELMRIEEGTGVYQALMQACIRH